MRRWPLAAIATGGAALAAAVVGLRAAGRRRAVLLAVAAGLADACSAVVTMAFSHAAGHGVAALATSWTVYAVAVCGAGNVLLTQSAYQTGRPILTLPIIAAVTPVASVAVGVGLLGETPGSAWRARSRPAWPSLVTGLALARLAYTAPTPRFRGQRLRPPRFPAPTFPVPACPVLGFPARRSPSRGSPSRGFPPRARLRLGVRVMGCGWPGWCARSRRPP